MAAFRPKLKQGLAGFAFVALAACNDASIGTPAPVTNTEITTEKTNAGGAPTTPSRIVSLDYCADQYVLGLSDRDAILALSRDVDTPYSFFRAQARGLPTVNPNAEAVLALKPDLIVRTYGGGPNAAAFFEQAGVHVLQIPYAADFDGVRNAARIVADGLGATDRAEELIKDMDARLEAVRAATADKTPSRLLYVTPGGVTSGPGSFIHEIFAAAGQANYETRFGWRPLPLEAVALSAPDFAATAFFGSPDHNTDAWTAARHPMARNLVKEGPSIALNSAFLACTAWFAVAAVEQIAGATNNEPQP